MLKILSLLLIAFSFSIILARSPMTDNQLDSFITGEMTVKRLPGLSAVVIKNNGVIWKGAYGYADIENGKKTTDSTIFLLASVSKLFTGTAAIQLYEKGLIDLDDDINLYLPFDIHVPGYENDPITFRMLLTHTSSIQDGNAMDDYYSIGDPELSLADCMVRYFSKNGADYDARDNFHRKAPGTYYDYSNMAVALLGYLVEVITDTPFDEYCENNLFIPLEMNNTAWRLDDLDINQVATPYGYWGGNYEPFEHYGFADYPNGSLRSNILDLSNFILSYMNGGSFHSKAILEKETIEEMWSRQVPALESTQGLSWYLETIKLSQNYLAWGHNGGEDGVSTDIYIIPEENVAVAVLANGEGSNMEIVERLFEYALEHEENAPVISGNVTQDGSPLRETALALNGDLVAETTTGTMGEYSFTVSYGGNYTVIPSKPGFSFQPSEKHFVNITEDQAQDFTANLTLVSIRGNVKSRDGVPLEGTSISLAGTKSGQTVTDSMGRYSFEVPSKGDYQVTPSKTGYSFEPPYHSIIDITTNQELNFTGNAYLYKISGAITETVHSNDKQNFDSVPLENTIIVFSPKGDTTYSDSKGRYEFSANFGDSGRITPEKKGYAFVPPYQAVGPIGEDQTFDFSAGRLLFTIDGHVRRNDDNGAPVPEVTMTLTGKETRIRLTNDSGSFSFEGNYEETYSLYPFKTGFSFIPDSIIIEKITGDSSYSFIAQTLTPIPVYPLNGTVGADIHPRFTWSYPYVGTPSFQVRLLRNGNLIKDTSNINDTSVIIRNLEADATYSWKVRVKEGNDMGEWSEIQTFSTINGETIFHLLSSDQSSLNNRHPLLLVHGGRANDTAVVNPSDYWSNFVNYYENDAELYQRFKVYIAVYKSNLISIEKLSQYFAEAVNRLVQEEPSCSDKERFIVSHGMGGLITRVFMRRGYGERTQLLITLGTPHHGSPLANGPARNALLDTTLHYLLQPLEEFLFSGTPYDEVNRRGLHWDNHDNFLDYETYKEETNSWLQNLNSDTLYDGRLISYSGTIPGEIQNPPFNAPEALETGSYIINAYFSEENDGAVPLSSSLFSGHAPRSTRIFKGYNHMEIVTGKDGSDKELFDSIKNDLLNGLPTEVTEKINEKRIFFTGNHPNPFSNETTIRFQTKRGEVFTLEIYDIMGRKVKTIFSGVLNSGKHAYTWHGKDFRGVNVSSGIYFIRFKGKNFKKNVKILKLK